MTRLEDFFISLAAVIIRYHDYKIQPLNPTNNKYTKLSDEEAKQLFLEKKTSCNVVEYLDNLIQEATVDEPFRKEFLLYILREVVFFKSIMDRTSTKDFLPIEEKKRIVEFFCNISQLLKTAKNNEVHINQSHNPTHEPLFLPGLKEVYHPLYNPFNNTLCTSGALIDELLQRLKMKNDSVQVTVTTIDTMYNAFFNVVLNRELGAQIKEQCAQIIELQTRIDTMQNYIQNIEKKNEVKLALKNLDLLNAPPNSPATPAANETDFDFKSEYLKLQEHNATLQKQNLYLTEQLIQTQQTKYLNSKKVEQSTEQASIFGNFHIFASQQIKHPLPPKNTKFSKIEDNTITKDPECTDNSIISRMD